MDYTERATIQKFCADNLLEGVESYKSDAFITYGQLVKMPLGTHAIVVVREMGVDFYASWCPGCFRWPREEGAARDWLRIYAVRRDITKTPLCWDDAVDYQLVDFDGATALMDATSVEDHDTYLVCGKCFEKLEPKNDHDHLYCPRCCTYRDPAHTYKATSAYRYIDK